MKNLLVRTISGIVFLAIMLGALLFSSIPYCIVFSFIIAVMMGEYLHISMGKGLIFSKILSILTGVLLFIALFLIEGYGMNVKYLFLLMIPIVAIIISLLYHRNEGDYNRSPYLLSAILYIALPFSLTNFTIFNSSGCFDGSIILSFFIILWSSDVGAYIFGMAFGQKNGHKLFPSISPKKSWEGYFGSVFTSLLAGFLISYFGLISISIAHSLIIALLINIFGTFGDLAESQLKRNFGVKDAGKIMPGHGGLLDRFDGALLSFPIAISYIMIFGL